MKRALLSALVVGMLAECAFSSMSFTFNKDAALMLTEISHSPSGVGIISGLLVATDDPGEYDPYAGMQGQVGYAGLLDATKAQKTAWMRIGATDTSTHKVDSVLGTALGTLATHSLASYDEYHLFLANDDNSDWSFRLFTIVGDTNPVTRESSAWTLLHPGEHTTLSLDLTGLDLTYVAGIGVDIGGLLNNVLPNPSDPDVFHFSVVSVPTAVILGLFGLGTAGLKLRKYA